MSVKGSQVIANPGLALVGDSQHRIQYETAKQNSAGIQAGESANSSASNERPSGGVMCGTLSVVTDFRSGLAITA